MRLQRLPDFLGRRLGRESLDHLPVAADQELREIPDDVFFPVLVGMARLEEFIDLAGALPVDFDLAEHRKRHGVFRSGELENFGVGPGLLRAELIARKAEDVEPFVVVMEGTQTCVLVGEASTTGDVDDQAELSFELGEPDRIPADRGHFEIVQTGHSSSSFGSNENTRSGASRERRGKP